MDLIQRTLAYLQDRRDKLLSGGINSIPSPFTRFSNDFIGIEQGKYYTVTGATKSGKTQLASYLFLYTPLLYAYENPNKVKLKVFYYALEETPEDVTQRFMSFLLNKLSKGKIRVSATDLQSTKNNSPISQEILDLLNSGEYAEILKFFEDTVSFQMSRNATGVYNDVRRYMEENGTVHKRKQKIKAENGIDEVEVFDWYEPNNENEYVIVFYDHLSLTQPERGMTLKQSADKLSEYFVILRNKYKVTPVLVQQQAFDMESLDAFKERKLRPTAQGLADSKYTARDCNCLLGIFNPFKHELPFYPAKGYDITKLRDNCRFLEVILNRGGTAGGLMGLYFDGATCTFAELPPLEDRNSLNKVYQFVEEQIKEKHKSVLLLLKNKINNFIKVNYE